MKKKRQIKIDELIKNIDIETQEELTEHLRLAGFQVTQATVSRDIKEMGIVKIHGRGGKYRYGYPSSERQNEMNSSKVPFSESVISIENAGNLVVIRCMSGMANAVCAVIDRKESKGIIGTIAGDDTIFIAMKTPDEAEELKNELLG